MLEAQARRKLQIEAYDNLPRWRKWLTRVQPEDIEVNERIVAIIGGAWASSDPMWTAATADNRWYLAQAAAYGANT